jgi:hypothetical protein
MKTCPSCGKQKSLEEFTWKLKAKGLKHSSCRECMRLYIQKHSKRNTDYYVKKARRRNKAIREESHKRVFEYFSTHPCVDCGETDPIVLEFDHIERKNKDAEVSAMVSSLKSWEKIAEEIEKCEVRCANCHRRRTAKQQGWYLYLTDKHSGLTLGG